jgi:hypothetical protein
MMSLESNGIVGVCVSSTREAASTEDIVVRLHLDDETAVDEEQQGLLGRRAVAAAVCLGASATPPPASPMSTRQTYEEFRSV